MRIPDDRSSRSQFAIIDDELDYQLRDILESNRTTESDGESHSIVFNQARDQYKACMDTDELEAIGLEPLKNILKDKFGGWPVLEGDSWNESDFDWRELNYKFRRNGYSADLLFDFSIGTEKAIYKLSYFDF